MTTKSLFLSMACAMALAAAPHHAKADDDDGAYKADNSGDDGDSVDCAKYSAKDIRNDIVKELKKSKDSACAHVKPNTVKLIGKLEPRACSGQGNEGCDEGKSFVQEFKGQGFEGHANVDWHFHRAGFVEYCETTLNDCKKD